MSYTEYEIPCKNSVQSKEVLSDLPSELTITREYLKQFIPIPQ